MSCGWSELKCGEAVLLEAAAQKYSLPNGASTHYSHLNQVSAKNTEL
jgi:hypothetical protein